MNVLASSRQMGHVSQLLLRPPCSETIDRYGDTGTAKIEEKVVTGKLLQAKWLEVNYLRSEGA